MTRHVAVIKAESELIYLPGNVLGTHLVIDAVDTQVKRSTGSPPAETLSQRRQVLRGVNSAHTTAIKTQYPKWPLTRWHPIVPKSRAGTALLSSRDRHSRPNPEQCGDLCRLQPYGAKTSVLWVNPQKKVKTILR